MKHFMHLRFLWVWLALLGSLFFTAPAQVTVVVEVLTPPQDAEPGDFITHTFLVTNNSATDQTFDLDLELSQGLSSLGLPSELDVAAGDAIPVFLTLSVTASTQAGTNEVTLTATSQTTPSNRDSVTAVVIVAEIASLEVLVPQDIRVQAGGELDVGFVILNTGNSFNEYEVSVRTDSELMVSVTPELVNLLPGESTTVFVRLVVPEDIVAQFVSITIMVTSTLNPDLNVDEQRIIEILPPRPEFFSTNLNLELPLQVSVSIADVVKGGQHTLVFGGNASAALDFPAGGSIEISIQNLAGGQDPTQFSVNLGFSDVIISLVAGGGLTAEASFSPLSFSISVADGNTVYLATLFTNLGQASLGGSFSVTSNNDGDRIRASAQLVLPLELIALQMNFSLLGIDPLGLSPDNQTLGIRFRFNEPRLTVAAGFEVEEINKSKNPALTTQSTVSAEVQSRISFASNLPVLTLELNSDLINGEGPGGSFLIENSFLAFTLKAEQMLFSVLSIEWLSTTSFLKSLTNNEDFLFFENALDLNLNFDLFTISARFQSDQSTDIVRGVTDNVSGASGAISFFEGPLSLSLSLQSFFSQFGTGLESRTAFANVSFGFRVADISVSASAGFELGVSESLNANMSLQVSSVFTFPTPIVGKGQVQGIIFEDLNGNGTLDDGEPGVPNIVLSVGGFRLITSENRPGFYRSPPLDPDAYDIELVILPVSFGTAGGFPKTISLDAGQRLTINIPLIPVGGIEGIVFNDLNQDGQLNANEPGLAGIGLTITGENIDPVRLRSNSTGQFALSNLPPGEYRVIVDEASLPTRFELTTPASVNIDLGIGELRQVAFGAFQRPQGITFAPAADFSFTPRNPQAGQSIRFDASASFDADGQIVKYEWDFNNDGVIDAEGVVVDHIFETGGTFTVTLRVTDNDDQFGIREAVIEVRE